MLNGDLADALKYPSTTRTPDLPDKKVVAKEKESKLTLPEDRKKMDNTPVEIAESDQPYFKPVIRTVSGGIKP